MRGRPAWQHFHEDQKWLRALDCRYDPVINQELRNQNYFGLLNDVYYIIQIH